MSRDWDAELRKIDRTLESVSDEALLPAKNAPTPAARVEAEKKQAKTGTLGVMLRLVLALILAIGMIFWPYGTRCGMALFGYLGAAGVVAATGAWTALWTWRHRSSRGHVLSLLITLWGILLAVHQVLPRTGYAVPTEERPAQWLCQ